MRTSAVRRPRTTAGMTTANPLASPDREGPGEGVTKRAALDALDAHDLAGPPPRAYPALIGPVHLLRVPRPLADLLPDSPWRAAMTILGAAAATAAGVVGVPPHVYYASLVVADVLLLRPVHQVLILFRYSPRRAPGLLLGAAAATAADLLRPLTRACAAAARIVLGLVVRVPRPGRAVAADILFAAATSAAETVGLPPDIYEPTLLVARVFLFRRPHPIVAVLFWSPRRGARLLLRAAATTAADMVRECAAAVAEAFLLVPRPSIVVTASAAILLLAASASLPHSAGAMAPSATPSVPGPAQSSRGILMEQRLATRRWSQCLLRPRQPPSCSSSRPGPRPRGDGRRRR